MELRFGFVAAPAGAPGATDRQNYLDLLRDCELLAGLGYSGAWVIEHHFSDYFPCPDPIGLLQHIAGHFPQLNLGTCVLVTPWHEPLRLAGSIAQLSNLTEAELHLGLGRGTAKYEYDAFGLRMDQARERFAEVLNVIRLALAGKEFEFSGLSCTMDRAIRVRPLIGRSKIHLYGAIGSTGTASVMADLGLPPICTSVGDFATQAQTLDAWRACASSEALQSSIHFPIMVNCIIEDTDEEAIAQASVYIPHFMKAQVDHYGVDETDWAGIKGYESWARVFEGMKRRRQPENIPDWTRWQFVGTPDTVARRVEALASAGFNHFLIHSATPGVPAEVRRRWCGRFITEVVPLLASRPNAPNRKDDHI